MPDIGGTRLTLDRSIPLTASSEMIVSPAASSPSRQRRATLPPTCAEAVGITFAGGGGIEEKQKAYPVCQRAVQNQPIVGGIAFDGFVSVEAIVPRLKTIHRQYGSGGTIRVCRQRSGVWWSYV